MTGPAGAIVGRDDDLTRLTIFLQAAEQGLAAFFINGQAGVGKTTLCQAGVDLAVERGFEVLACRPAESEAKLSYAGLADLLSPILESVLDLLPDLQRTALEIALLLKGPGSGAHDQRTVAAATLAALKCRATQGRLMLTLDDLQWLDRPSAHVLAFALRRWQTEPLGVLASVRSGARTADLDISLPGNADTTRVTLGPLSAGAIERMMKSRLGATFSRPILLRIHQTSGGNPFYALELARALVARSEPLVPGEPLPISEDFTALMAERVSRLPARTRQALLLASLMQKPTEPLIHDAGASPADLDPAVVEGVVAVERHVVRFAHPLLAAAVVRATPPERRREAHRRLATVVREPEEQARHRAMATVGTDGDVAVALEEAARSARARGAPDAAADLAEQAASLTPNEEAKAFLRRKMMAADHHYAAGDTLRALDLLDEAAQSASPGPERAEVLWRLGQIRYMTEAFPLADDLFRQALDEVGGDEALRARLEQAMAFSSFVQGDVIRAEPHARKALELAEGVGEPRALGLALSAVGLTKFLLGQGIDEELMEGALDLDSECEDAPIEWRPSFSYAWMKMSADDLEGGRALFEALRARALELGDEGSTPTLLVFLSLLECRAGNWALADRYAVEAEAASSQSGQQQTRLWSLYAGTAVDACFGRFDEAKALEGLAMAERTGAIVPISLFLSVLGFDALSRGDHAEAHQRLGPLTNMVSAMGILEPGPYRFLADDIEALIALGEIDAAASLTDRLEERGRTLGRAWPLAAGARCRGLLLATRGDSVGALEAFDLAVRRHRDLDQPFELGRTLLARGQVERRARKWGDARSSLRESLEVFETLGARLWADRARDEMARIGGRTATPSDLTETERRVAQLVATGLTNQAAADALFMSPRTVQANLARVFRKLGVRSRAELAARLRPEVAGRADPHT